MNCKAMLKGHKASVTFFLAAVVGVSSAQAQTAIRISVQPGNYAAIAYKVASKLGYWKEAGLEPSFVTYAAGVPQIKGNADWDVGTMGAVPALIGARDFDLITIAVANDESRTNVLMGGKEFVTKVKQQRSIPDGSRIAVTQNSTGDYAMQACLALWGGKLKAAMKIAGMSQPDAMAAGAGGSADLVALWAPNSYSMTEKHGFEVLCTGKDFSPGVFGVTVAKRSWAKSNSVTVAKFLSVVIRANRWIKRNAEATQQIHREASAKEGVVFSANAARQDNELRPVFDLDEQIELMRGTAVDLNDSRVSRAFYSLNVFLNEGKTQTRQFRPSTFVDTTFLELVKDDANLRLFIQRP